MGEVQQIRRTQLTDALLSITATRGLDQVSVREVASAAGVSIGTVQREQFAQGLSLIHI